MNCLARTNAGGKCCMARTQLVAVTVLLFLISKTVAFCVAPSGTTLAWDPVTNAAVSGYRLRWGTVSRSYTSVVDAGNTTSVTVSALSDGLTYFFAVTAYGSDGVESAFSSEVSFTPGAT